MSDKSGGRPRPAATEAARRAEAERRERQAEALRRNLNRRKTQARQRDQGELPSEPTGRPD